jgi:tRNA (mo5U34)-methyltransferase
LAPTLEVKDIDVYDLSPSTVGTFDFVLFAGVLYHTRHPLLALERAASVCTDVLVVETVLDATSFGRPAMVFYPSAELKGDPSNWWGPNQLCVEAMLRDVGFNEITFTITPIPRRWTIYDWVKHNPAITPRGVFHARRGA